MAHTATAPLPAQSRPFRALDHFFVSCLWLAYNVQWGALLAVVLPLQIEAIVGPKDKEFYNGLIGPIGGIIALIIAPLAGALSDRARGPKGRRRSFLIVGMVINVAFLLWMATFGKGSSLGLFIVCYLGVQLGSNWWGGPYAGLIPDVVPVKDRGTASGWMALMTAVGTIIGALSAGQMLKMGFTPIYLLIVVSLIILLLVTLVGVKEKPALGVPEPFQLGPFIRSFYLDPKEYRNFYWVLVTRAMVTMGIYSIFTFFQYFLKDVIGVSDPVQQSSFLIGIITVAGIPTAMIAGPLSDKKGRKPLVYLSGAIMAVASIVYIAVAVNPSLGFTFAVAAVFGIGYGAYQAVDWALAVDVLPGGESAAKDMGIWHVAIVLPQIIAPFVTGLTVGSLKSQSIILGYTVVFIITAIWFILGTVFVRQIKGVR